MPIQIDDVQADVSVDPQGAAAPQAQRRSMPSVDEMQRWMQIARRNAWDEARTRSLDRDD
jgi:hypothetical protein